MCNKTILNVCYNGIGNNNNETHTLLKPMSALYNNILIVLY